MLVVTRSISKDTTVDIGGFLTLNIVDWDSSSRSVRLSFKTSIDISIMRDNAINQSGQGNKKGNLVLTRKEGQTVFVGDDIAITVLKVTSQNARIGIDAPKEIPILRVEAKAIDTSIEV